MSIIRGIMVPHPPIIIPEIGRGEEQKIAQTVQSYTELGRIIAELEPETIVITSPHSILYADYFHISPGKSASGSFDGFSAPQVRLSADYDTELVDEIVSLADQHGFPAGIMGERNVSLDHGTMIPLYFIEKGYAELGKEPDYKVVRIGLSGLSLLEHYAFGALISQASENLGRRTLFAASGDLSHYLKEDGPYGFRREGPEYDRQVPTDAACDALSVRMLLFPWQEGMRLPAAISHRRSLQTSLRRCADKGISVWLIHIMSRWSAWNMSWIRQSLCVSLE